MTALEKYIQHYFGIDQESLQTVAALFEADQLQKGDYFIKHGSYCKKLSFVKSGYLRVYLANEKKEITQWVFSNDYFVTDLASLIFDAPAKWNIQALTDCSMYSISSENYRRIGEIVPKWHILEKLFLAKCFSTLEDRVYSLLSMSAEERYQALFQMNSTLFNEVPLHYLASMLGMTPETLSRIRKNATS